MDFTKFVDLLDTRTLFFTRSDLYDDPFEGSLTNNNIINSLVFCHIYGGSDGSMPVVT
jgi:hypothetical protein